MSKNVMTVSPSEDIYDALLKMKGKMAGKSIRWLPVAVKGSVIGMLTVKDILRIEPSLFEIAVQHHNLHVKEEENKLLRRNAVLAGKELWIKEGTCEECGSCGLLQNIDGILFCESCSLTAPRLR